MAHDNKVEVEEEEGRKEEGKEKERRYYTTNLNDEMPTWVIIPADLPNKEGRIKETGVAISAKIHEKTKT